MAPRYLRLTAKTRVYIRLGYTIWMLKVITETIRTLKENLRRVKRSE